MLLEGCGDGGFARGREAGEPDGQALLAAEPVALFAREGRVPGDIACVVSLHSWSWLYSGAITACATFGDAEVVIAGYSRDGRGRKSKGRSGGIL